MHDAWGNWPDDAQNDFIGDNLDNQDENSDDVQHDSVTFDQSGSTAEYLRATGPDIPLHLDEIASIIQNATSQNVIGHLGLVELPLKGHAFTWSNMQQDPLLEQLDWFFTSANWTLDYPNSLVLPLAKITSDHIHCKLLIGTSIPKANIFIFENF